MVELAAFVCYLVVVLAVGVYFFLKGKKTESGDKHYFLGGRNMNGLVAALSAGASDMSAWVLMWYGSGMDFRGTFNRYHLCVDLCGAEASPVFH